MPSLLDVPDPLDPLRPDELGRAVALCRGDDRFGADPRFVWVALAEPDKTRLLAGEAVARRAEIVVVDRATGLTVTGLVDLDASTVVAVQTRPGEHASITVEEWEGASRVLDDDRVIAALARRGLGPDARLHLEPWPFGFGDPSWDSVGRRLGRVTFFVRDHDADTAWARPVENLIVVADRISGEVVTVLDGDLVAVPPGAFPIEDPALVERDDVKPLLIEQPEGPSYRLEGNVLTWQRWRIHVGFHPLDGLVLRDITYDDPETGRRRRVAWRMSMSEMAVPYGDPSMMHQWRHVFDAGEVGLGKNATPLTLGCDCLGHIDYLDEHMVTPDGDVVTIGNAVCIHEEDNSVLWRHFDSRTGTTAVRRRRRLVVSSWTNLGNYDYGFYWKFGQDGTIEVECCLTGVVLASATPDDESPGHGVRVAPGLTAPHHQHLFSFRLDLDVDGVDNVVEEVELVAAPMGPDNPIGAAMVTTHTVLERESTAKRRTNALGARSWLVKNRAVENPHGEPVGFKVVPASSPLLLADPSSPVAGRAAFATHHLWVTSYEPSELRAAGDFPNQHTGGAGLPAYTAADRSLVDTDVVLWLTCGVSHIVRPEDFPVMPAARVSFVIEPVGFFASNPALDVPPQTRINPTSACHTAEGASGGCCE